MHKEKGRRSLSCISLSASSASHIGMCEMPPYSKVGGGRERHGETHAGRCAPPTGISVGIGRSIWQSFVHSGCRNNKSFCAPLSSFRLLLPETYLILVGRICRMFSNSFPRLWDCTYTLSLYLCSSNASVLHRWRCGGCTLKRRRELYVVVIIIFLTDYTKHNPFVV